MQDTKAAGTRHMSIRLRAYGLGLFECIGIYGLGSHHWVVWMEKQGTTASTTGVGQARAAELFAMSGVRAFSAITSSHVELTCISGSGDYQ